MGKTMILSLTYNNMPLSLPFWSSLWGTESLWETEKPFIKNWVDGKVLSNLVSDNIKISTYCATGRHYFKFITNGIILVINIIQLLLTKIVIIIIVAIITLTIVIII